VDWIGYITGTYSEDDICEVILRILREHMSCALQDRARGRLAVAAVHSWSVDGGT